MADKQIFKELKTILPKVFIGNSLEMSFSKDTSFDLWRNFMPRRNEIENRINSDLFSIQIFDALLDFNRFDPELVYQNWAVVEVSQVNRIPENMKKLEINGGLYAVFIHRGTKQMIFNTWNYIHNFWMPKSGYRLDFREHFQILREGYNPNSPDSEEELWVPVKKDNPSE